jgi:RNA polymerase sigma factor (sigma-70 family)
MTMRYSRTTIEEVHSLFHLGAMGAWADSRLITHFLSGQAGAEVAFRVLLHRHGPMVLTACRRVLGDAHAAEDAFQATFLVLVKKAGSIQSRESLTGWLYGVALRVSRKARAQADRRRVVERQAAEKERWATEDRDRAEVRALIDEEIRRLPERYREPLLLCYLEGLRHHEIAERLDCPVGTVESRLSRGRERLRSRLVLRGLATTAGMLGMILRPSEVSAAIPSTLVESSVRAALEFASGRVVGKAASAAALTGAAPWLPSGSPLPGLVASIGIVFAGFGAYWSWTARAVPEQPRTPEARAAVPERTPSPPPEVRPVFESTPPRATTTAPPPIPERVKPLASRPDSAVAVPLADITIDGKLDDWPTNLDRHPIRRVLRGHPDYDSRRGETVDDPEAYFQAGYDRLTGRIYLAVTVRDADLVAAAGDAWHTDAVEVYVEGLFTERSIPDWPLDASKLPVLQYVAIPARAPAYKDPRGSNPSLLYGKLSDTTTTMAYRRDGDLTTYEWAIQVFDQYPGRPTELEPGKRIGLDVVVVDKDRDREKPTWLHWGPPPTRFKGTDAGLLGELILGDGP